MNSRAETRPEASHLEVDVNGRAANGDDAVLQESIGQNGISRSKKGGLRTKLLFWQQTGWELQEVPPTPTALMGEQVIPTSAVKSDTTTPRRPRSKEAALELAYNTEVR